ncbi:MAG TPA: HEPN domain-containing protein [Spirochaetota bacterium]|nr:HEPN domain-containing protein [Spirochaetota bacterium]HPF05707.1 HEPN domain-containing protein [Spirochaetota bacterium]HPJ42808.1 HEPN domain-containing protein [Spirochaetota bacterium]HRX48025.1 HEPN domain-containing protein [Spirochaetota bacterium]
MDRNKELSEWLKYALDDLESAEILNQQHKKPLNIICYHCQQAAEKYLKGFLVSKYIPFEKTHDLLKLIESCQDIDQSFSILVRDCIKLNPYSIITRYPSELELIENDALSAIRSAKNIREHVKKSIKD